MNNKLIHIARIAVVMLCMAALPSCDDEETKNKEVVATPSLSVSPTSLTFSKSGGTQSLNVYSTTEPTILTADSWLKAVLVATTDTTYLYNVTAEAYSNGTADRTSSLSILAGDLSTEVSITQSYTLAQTIKVDANGGNFTINIDNSSDATITIDALWITNNTDGSYTATANANNSTRTGYIIYTLNNSSDTISIVQAAGAEPSFSFSSTAMDIAPYMYPAWNLGNTMEATGSGLSCETSWQSTKTTQAIIDYVKASGFKSVRIPCSWYIHSDKNNNYTINADWMSRVKEIVSYCINDGLFVELNDHWDSGWLEELGFTSSTSEYTDISDNEDYINGKIEILKNLWTQIATEMKDFDYHLIFAGLNEPFQNYSLFNGRAESLTPVLLKYNQAFVDAVRATGGNNAERVLAVQGPATNIDYTVNYFTMPTDNVDNKLMVEVHYYDPYNFCLNEGTGYVAVWNSENSLKNTFAKMKTKFADNNIPVVIGEYAANWRTVNNQEKHNASIKAFYKAVSKWGPANGMIPFAWDTNYCPSVRGTSGTGTIINRATLEIYNPYAYEGIKQGTNATVWMK